ncbi:MAG: hypothetical protein Tsb0020_17980 [Haliangiales bacterium]
MYCTRIFCGVLAPILAIAVATAVLGLWSPWGAPASGPAVAGSKGKGEAKPAAKPGAVAGVVSYQGAAPERTNIDRGTDPVCAKKPKLTETVVVEDGKLRDVYVRLANGSAGPHSAPAQPVVVDQQECMYVPRVVGVMAGQELLVKNSDPTYHNVRGTKHEHTEWNLGQPPHAPAITRKALGEPGEVVTLRCDIHPWMRGYAVISDHPYFDVSAADGSFALKGVPAGRYTIEAWHPELGDKRAEVTVKPGQTAKVSLSYP